MPPSLFKERPRIPGRSKYSRRREDSPRSWSEGGSIEKPDSNASSLLLLLL